MRYIISILIYLITTAVNATTFYVAPTGNDAAAGTFAAPWKTWGKAFNASEVGPGDTVFFRGGIYYKDVTEGENGWYYPTRAEGGSGYNITREGIAGNWIYYWGYPDDIAVGNYPILDCTNGYDITINSTTSNFGIRNGGTADYCHFKGLVIQNVKQYNIGGTIYPRGFVTAVQVSGQPMIWEHCTVRYIHGHGFNIGGATAPNFNYLINCDGYHCCDSLTVYNPTSGDGPGNDGMGFYTVYGGNLKLINCRAWLNGDQGYSNGINDAGSYNQYTEYEGCWSFRNGMMTGAGEGFKMGWIAYTDGKIKRTYKNCVSVFNKANGWYTYDFRRNIAVYANIYNCTSYHNGYQGTAGGYTGYGFWLNATPDDDAGELMRNLVNNIAYANENGNVLLSTGAVYTHNHNTWDLGLSLSDADFQTVDSTGLMAARQADGSLPDNNCYNYFLRPTSVSPVINAGTDTISATVVIDSADFNSTEPDLGAYEYTVPDAPTDPLVATTGMPINITSRYATGTGSVTYQGGSLTYRFLCWSESATPTIFDNLIACGSGVGQYTGSITGLSPNTTYYIRAYAVNEFGSSYGAEYSFTTDKWNYLYHGGKIVTHNGKPVIIR